MPIVNQSDLLEQACEFVVRPVDVADGDDARSVLGGERLVQQDDRQAKHQGNRDGDPWQPGSHRFPSSRATRTAKTPEPARPDTTEILAHRLPRWQ